MREKSSRRKLEIGSDWWLLQPGPAMDRKTYVKNIFKRKDFAQWRLWGGEGELGKMF